MYDIFLTEDVHKLVERKSIVFLGDSNIRALYKDFLCLLHNSRFIPEAVLKKKMENVVYGDKLVSHGRKTNGRCYREEREALVNGTRASFYFLTKVYDNYVENVLDRITRRSKPDVIIINSCVWDITRWGCNGVYDYKENLRFLMKEFSRLLPNCLVIWITTPPLAAEVKGGFLVKELQFLKYSLRFHVVEANHFARKVVVDNGFDVLDTHFHLQMQIHRRSHDGIHWDTKSVRYVTNLILRHISLSWNVPLPHRYESSVVDENLVTSEDTKNPRIIKLGTKKTAIDVKQVHSRESDVSERSEKLKSIVTVVNKKEDSKKKRRGSIQLYRAPKKEESIHNHMAKAEIKARRKRIRQWKKPLQGDSPQSCAPSFGRNSRVKNITRNRQYQRPPHEANLSNNSFQSDQQSLNPVIPSTPVCNSLKAPLNKSLYHNVPLVTSPSQIPLPPYSPGYQQPHNSHMQSDEAQLSSFNRSFDFPLITSHSQIPLPPYCPGHHQSDDSPIRNGESQLQTFDGSVHFDFPIITSPSQIPCPPYNQLDNVLPQRRVVDYQTTRWASSSFTNNGNKASSHSRSAFLNRQFRQCNRIFETVNGSVKAYKFPQVTSGQILQPRFDFANDEMPQVYLF